MSQVDLAVLEELTDKFTKYVHFQDKNDSPLNFTQGNNVLVKEEGYKALIAGKAGVLLNSAEWNESWIDSGEIKKRICKAIDLSDNLVNFNTKNDFKNHFDAEQKAYNPDSERVIYEIFKGTDDKAAFEQAITVFGAKYPIIAFLFFIKDMDRYLPVSPTALDMAFKELNIDFQMSYKCSWDNYCQYLDIMNEIRNLMPKYMDISHNVRLIDAHSFVWIIREERFIEWIPDQSDINTAMMPKNVAIDSEGIIHYLCPRCDCEFRQAKRCPECGQAIKEN